MIATVTVMASDKGTLSAALVKSGVKEDRIIEERLDLSKWVPPYKKPQRRFLEDDVIRCGHCGSVRPSVRNYDGWLCCPDCGGI
jgi:hypothetical protein